MISSKIGLSLLLAIFLTGGSIWGWSVLNEGGNPDTNPTFTVPEKRTVASTVLATGSIQPKVGAEVRVGSQMSGIVRQLNVTVGSKIKQGDVIAVIDSRALEARHQQALAQVKVLEQEVRRVEVQFARAQKLDARGFVARSQLEDLGLELAEVQARLEKTQRDADVVKTDLSYAQIQAPISGTIASVTTQEGETVAASFATPTFVTIINNEELELVALVDETDIGNVAAGNPVYFTVEAYPTMEFEGVVKQVAPKGTLISGVVNFQVMISIESSLDLLKPDMTANVSVQTAEREALVVPSQAILRDGFERYVYVEKDGALVKRTVIVGSRDNGGTEIRQGIGPNDKIAIVPPKENVDNNVGS
jgi:RND family efflux transporter MFP subunit